MFAKELFESCFAGKNDRLPFFPLLANYAARVEQLAQKDLLMNVSRLTKALQNTQKLFKTDGILIAFTLTLEAEALGCRVEWHELSWSITGRPEHTNGLPLTPNWSQSGRIPQVLEVGKRLHASKGTQIPLCATMTGPLTLASMVTGLEFQSLLNRDPLAAEELIDDIIIRVLVPVCQAYFHVGIQTMLIAEEQKPHQDIIKLLGDKYETLQNMVRHFGGRTVFLGKEYDSETLQAIINQWPFNAVIVNERVDLQSVIHMAVRSNKTIGLGVPTLLLSQWSVEETMDWARTKLTGLETRGIFLTTDWDVPLPTPLENLQALAGILFK